MIRNFIKIALRNLIRNRSYSLINITGLAVGMSVTMLIGLWTYDELSFNTYHSNYKDIAQVYYHQQSNGEVTTQEASPLPLAEELKSTFKHEFKNVVTMWWESNHVLTIEDKKASPNGTFMDAEGLSMFSFRMLKGNYESLKDPASIVLSATTARILFADVDPLNKILRLDDKFDVKVTGVYEDFPYNSRFHSLHFAGSWEFWLASNPWLKVTEQDWNANVTTFVEIQPTTTFETASARIKDAKLGRITKEQALSEKPQLFLEPMSRWHLYSEWQGGERGGRIQFVWLFSIIGAFVLILACINFMNLSTALSEKRAREVGLRKSIGSGRGQLINQFLSESFVVVAFSFVIAGVIVAAVLPWFNGLANKQMVLPLTNIFFWLTAFAFIVITSLLSGSYPALYLSSFQPIDVLKGTFRAGRLAALPRKVLVVLQFTVSITLIVGTVIVWQQIQFAKDRPIGYTREGLIMVRKNSSEMFRKADILANEIKNTRAAVELAESSNPATEWWFVSKGFNWKGKDPNLEQEFVTMAVTHDYGKTLGWTFLKGRDFSRTFSTDSSGIVLNETAAKSMGFSDPIDEETTWNNKRYKIIGVIRDMVMNSPYDPVKPTVFYMDYKQGYVINIRLNPLMSANESLGRIEDVFRQLMPSVPFDYKFVDQEYALKFASEERVGKLASVFAVLAIFISCLGLFGMASFVTEQRKKEIGIRKTLGASVSTLWKMLSTEFLLLVGLSCLIGIPVAWTYLDRWLETYSYHVTISPWVFVFASGGALLITLLTVSFQTITASLANPVKSLRSE